MSDDLRRTYLDTSDGTAEYAKRYGAIFDVARYQWYVLGEVPSELFNLIPKQKNNPASKIVAPSCPRCGFHTVLRHAKNNNEEFWGCSQFRISGCRGSVDYVDHLNSINAKSAKSVAEILSDVSDEEIISKSAIQKPINTDSAIQERRAEIANLSIKTFGAAQSAKWLTMPKVNLSGKTPISIMNDVDGCEQVLALIRSCQ